MTPIIIFLVINVEKNISVGLPAKDFLEIVWYARSHARTPTYSHTHTHTHTRTHARTHAHTLSLSLSLSLSHTHARTHARTHADYTKLNLDSNRDLRWMKTAARNGKHSGSIVLGKEIYIYLLGLSALLYIIHWYTLIHIPSLDTISVRRVWLEICLS